MRITLQVSGALLVLGALLGAGGCFLDNRDDGEPRKGMVQIGIVNETNVTIRASLHVGEHSPGDLGVTPLADGERVPCPW